jgi:hypothetical protein
MSSMTTSSERTIRSTTFPVDASILERAMVAVRLSRVNQLTRRARSIAAWAIASAKWDLPVPDGPTRTRFSARPIQSNVRRAHWASPGIAEALGSHASNVLPDGSRASLRCISRVEPSRPAASSDDDSESRPGEPSAPQERLLPADPRAFAPVELKPHTGLRDPGPEDPPVAGRVRLLGLSDGTSGCPLGALEAERPELVMDHIGPDLAV